MDYFVKRPKWAPKEWIQDMSAWRAPNRLWKYKDAYYNTEYKILTLIYSHKTEKGQLLVKYCSKEIADYLLADMGVPRRKFIEWEKRFNARRNRELHLDYYQWIRPEDETTTPKGESSSDNGGK